MATVLVTDGQQRKSLAVVRALGRAGHRVLIAEDMRCTTAFFSHYAAGRAVYPSPASHPAQFRAWLHGYLRREAVDVFLAMDDEVTAAVLGETLPCAALLPSPDAFSTFRDKARTLALAEQLGLDPPAWRLADDDPVRALHQAAEVGYPLAIKPRITSGGRGMRLVREPHQFAKALAAVAALHPRPILQRWIGSGSQLDVGLIYDRSGSRAAAFVQRELRHYPLVGGPSTLQESVHAPELIDIADRLLTAVGWVGPAEVEFRLDPDGRPRLMEINPRYWASLALAIQAGVNFPCLHVQLATGCPYVAPAAYPAGLRCRWLLPGDVLHFLANADRRRMDPPFWHTYDARTRDDIIDARDLGPVLGFALAALVFLVQPKRRRMVLR